MSLRSKKIVVGVTGGIAAYKTCELVRELKKQGAQVRVVMTEAARQFVSELTFSTLSENPVQVSLFEVTEKETAITHIELSRWCDLCVVCPATANVIGKISAGIADDLLTTTVMATRAPVLFCPAMNASMWENSIVQANVARLKQHGYVFLDPEWGAFATDNEGKGWGRLPETQTIVRRIKQIVLGNAKLLGKHVLITAGPTREHIDPVRFLSNYSTGKMGFALAEAALLFGAEVTLVAGPNHLPELPGVRYVMVESAQEMKTAVERFYDKTDILVMAAAVADYTPEHVLSTKMKKKGTRLRLAFKQTLDILANLAKKKAHRIHVGFALETENTEQNALQKLHDKDLDMIVLNDPTDAGAGFAGDTNVVTIFTKNGNGKKYPIMKKTDVARTIMERVSELVPTAASEILVV